MESPEALPTLDEALDEWKRALEEIDWAALLDKIRVVCKNDHNHEGLMKMDPFPDFEARRNILHFIIFESDRDFEQIEEKFRLPVVQAMVEITHDKKARAEFVNEPDANGVTPLQMAAMEGHARIARYLIEQGAHSNSRDRDDVTPLHWAAENLRPGVVRLLLENLEEEDRMPYDDEFCTPANSLARRLEKGGALKPADYEAAEEVKKLLGGREQENPNNKLMCQILALGETGEGDVDAHAFDRPINVILDGSPPVIQRMREYLLSEDDREPRWKSYGIFLPQSELKLTLRAAELIFQKQVKRDDACKVLLDRIEHMAEPGKLRGPGFYTATPLAENAKFELGIDRLRQVNAILKDVYCIVLPILEVKSRKQLREERGPQPGVKQQSLPHQTAQRPDHSREPAEDTKLDGKGLLREQSLDEYCHNFLSGDALRKRDESQVVGRWAEREERERRESEGRRPRDGLDEIVIVSHLWIWKFGDFFISSYGNDQDFSPSMEQYRNLSHGIYKGGPSIPNESANVGALHAIMEACVRYEPRFPRSESRELLDGAGAFAEEIAHESSSVATYFENYLENLGRVDKDYKRSVRDETNALLRLDDALGELAMIRRVREDLRLICMDRLNNPTELDRWAERSESKLRRLENDALRVRESLVTLLSLKQSEVNTENLLSSKDQSRILFVFAAATVLFTPLSWISSLMALDIKDFSPQDSVWSMSAAATASTVTLIGFAVLMVLTLFIWGWWDDRKDHDRNGKSPRGSNVCSDDAIHRENDSPKRGGNVLEKLRDAWFRFRGQAQSGEVGV